jgi:hydroxymethylglutaryl-CoA reductase (NADPH)
MVDYWRMSAIGGVLSGTLGVQGHFANGLAALYLATGQDAACVAESATGVTRFEVAEDGGLYASVTVPGIMVGTVGGGTGLPTQRACLELMGLAGEGKAAALAEVCAGLLLGGELSIIAALSAGHFARAHRKLARQRKPGASRAPTAAGSP